MRTLTSMFTILALTLALGCAGGDDGEVIDGVDAAVAAPDAAAAAPDAMPTNPPITSGLGQLCDQSAPCSDQLAANCIAFSQSATHGICTFECASDIPSGTNPDAAASQACTTAYTGSTGTPLCAAGTPDGANVDWSCLIACGMLQGMELGECPGGLTCTDNTCQ